MTILPHTEVVNISGKILTPGFIAPGAKADLVVLDASSRSMLGWNDPVAAVMMMHAGVGTSSMSW